MKVVVIGLGSMGRRRIRLMQSLPEPPEIVGIDLSRERRAQAERETGVRTAADLGGTVAAFAPEVALVCTSPASHGELVLRCLQHGLHVFTEINLLSDWYDEAMSMAEKRGLLLFLSSTFLYRKEVEYIADAVKGDTVNYIYHSGQYLPDWHPWESYKDFFVSKKETNACREILAIEFPWICKAFGEIESVQVMRDKMSTLEVDFPDNYMISVRHRNGNKGVFCQDVVSRKGLRRLEIYSENLHLFWEGTPQSLEVLDLKEKALKPVTLYDQVEQRADYNANIIEDAYRAELANFFGCLAGTASPRHTFAADKRILELIDGIEGGRYGA